MAAELGTVEGGSAVWVAVNSIVLLPLPGVCLCLVKVAMLLFGLQRQAGGSVGTVGIVSTDGVWAAALHLLPVV